MRFLTLFLLISSCLQADLTVSQKLLDFQALAGVYNKNYAPDEVKQLLFQFNLFDLKPWLDRVRASKTDLEFYDICVEYVASLNDSHDEFILPANFQAYLPVDLDFYEGKVLIDGVDRSVLPRTRFPFTIGDEVISVDGKPVAEVVKSLEKYAANGRGNPSTTRRLAADAITFRYQGYNPYAAEIGDKAVFEIKEADGQIRTYELPYDKYGMALVTAGTLPDPILGAAEGVKRSSRNRKGLRQGMRRQDADGREEVANPWGIGEDTETLVPDAPSPAYMAPLEAMQQGGVLNPEFAAASFGALAPAFNPPAGFSTRVASASIGMLTGTFPLNGKRVGFIRVATMSPASTTTAVSTFATEIAFMQANTDALVIDVMRNGGGNLCYTESLLRYLYPVPFRSIAYEIRATNVWRNAFSSAADSARAAGADQWVIDLYRNYAEGMGRALQENRARTGDLPICGPTFLNTQPARSNTGALLAYTRPILVLTDEFTLSAAEALAALLQDGGRATLFGTRTDGGGGNVSTFAGTIFSEGSTRVTRSLITRDKPVQTPGFPAMRYWESVGVYPDVVNDIMTKANLLSGGSAFVQAFTAEVAKLIP